MSSQLDHCAIAAVTRSILAELCNGCIQGSMDLSSRAWGSFRGSLLKDLLLRKVPASSLPSCWFFVLFWIPLLDSHDSSVDN